MTSSSRPSSGSPDPGCLLSIFFTSNIHCASCVAYVREVLSEVPAVKDIEVSILTHEVRVRHGQTIAASELATKLIHAAFEVHHFTTYDSKRTIVADHDTTSWLARDPISFANSKSSTSTPPPERTLHIANCDACRKEYDRLAAAQSDLPTSHDEKSAMATARTPGQGYPSDPNLRKGSDAESLVPRDDLSIAEKSIQSSAPQSTDEEFSARLSIAGMSCSSCVNAITSELDQLEFVKEVTVTLLTNSASLVFTGPLSNIDKIIEHIEDIGFEASSDEITEKTPAKPTAEAYVAELAISGMTCGSCVGAVTKGVEELPFVTNVCINLMSNSGRIEYEGQQNIDGILEKIDDLGYDAAVDSVRPLAGAAHEAAKARTVFIRVDGMFCRHCPQKVADSLKGLTDVEVEEMPSVKDPILKITYTPHPVTIRSILSEIDNAHDAFKATVYHPPTIEERSREMQRHETRRLLSRLLFVLAVTIPTFIIGIVFMSLVSSNNPTRRYLEQPIWSGSVSRTEWALFIMTTPVMVYGTDVFHVRALKEIYTLWRPGSRAPILRRFYRFGSMNLLISAGTTVAYFASLAVLIMDAVMRTKSTSNSSTYFDSVVFLTLFILAGRFLEAYSKAKTGDAVTSLGSLRPSEALLVDQPSNNLGESDSVGPGVRRIDVDLLEIGDTVSIPHGASPPADGIVTGSGVYQFDESSLTGESKPVKKSTGGEVYTGSVNVGQAVEIKLSAVGASSMLDQIIAVVRDGQSKRAPLERIADVLTSHFVPVITLIAIVTFVLWLALGLSGVLPADYLDNERGGWPFWALEFAISVFVVACPCGLALAAPTALFVGGGLAARHGILVKGGGEAFQEASRLDAIVFDKTGTLTEGGSLKVSDHEILTKDDEKQQLAWTLARKLEESSNHPIARAIMESCSGQPSVPVSSSDIHEIPGHGMKGKFTLQFGAERTVEYEAAIGNERLLEQLVPADVDRYYLFNLLSKYQSAGKSTAILCLRKIDPESPESFAPAIIFATSDLIRPEAAQVISELRERNVDVFMCTGDNQTTAHAVADMLGISRSNVTANVMPPEKAEFVRKVQGNNIRSDSTTQTGPRTRLITAFVGDGVNDSPALAAADVSIAMASGSDVAMNSASFILLNSDLNTILQLVVLSRRVFNRVKMNFGWALVYNLILVPVAAGVFYPIVSGHHQEVIAGDTVTVNEHFRLGPVWAALAMALSSISVICSSLALGIERRHLEKVFRWMK